MSQYFEQALAAKLNAMSALVALLGTGGIFSQGFPQTWQLDANGPALAYTVPDKPMGHVLVGSDGTALANVTFNVRSYNYGISKQIVEAIANELDGIPGVWGDGTCIITSVVQQNETDEFIPPGGGSDKWIYHIDAEYAVRYRVSLPALV